MTEKKQKVMKKEETAKTNATGATSPEKPMQNYNVSQEFRQAVRGIFGTKPFIQVAGIITLLEKDVMTEAEVNNIINVLGNFSYDEVAQIFTTIQQHVKPVVNETKEEK